MRKDSRLSRVLHVLVHLEHFTKPATSDDMAKMMNTNPVVVRRIMSSLREAGYVTSAKGHGGGWALAKSLDDITLYDIHAILGESSLFTIGLTDENNHCLIEKGVNQAIGDVLSEAEQLVIERFKQVTLRQLAAGFKPQC